MSPPLSLVCLIFNRMATFHEEGKVGLIVPANDFGISHVTEKCLCAMFGFHSKIVHVSKDKTYDDNNNVIRSIYQFLVLGDFRFEWRVNFRKFRIVGENLLKSF
jgi:hypothetical protein